MMTAIALLASIKTAKRRANFQLQRSLPLWVSTLLVVDDEGLGKGCGESEEGESIVCTAGKMGSKKEAEWGLGIVGHTHWFRVCSVFVLPA